MSQNCDSSRCKNAVFCKISVDIFLLFAAFSAIYYIGMDQMILYIGDFCLVNLPDFAAF